MGQVYIPEEFPPEWEMKVFIHQLLGWWMMYQCTLL